MRKARSSPRARQQIRNIWQYIARDNRHAANSVIADIERKIAGAVENPEIGVSRPDLGHNRRVLFVHSYVVVYEPDPRGIFIIAVVHGMTKTSNWLD